MKKPRIDLLARPRRVLRRFTRTVATRRQALQRRFRATPSSGPRPRMSGVTLHAPPVRIAVVGMLVAAMIVAILGIAHVARRQQVIRLGYQLSRSIEDLSRKQEENRRLRLEKATLTNPDRIRRLAESLGMNQPGPDQIRVLLDPGPVITGRAKRARENQSRSSHAQNDDAHLTRGQTLSAR